jgi:hypothetical protein
MERCRRSHRSSRIILVVRFPSSLTRLEVIVSQPSVALFAVALLASAATAAPVPTHLFPKTPPCYFPTTAGAKWIYEGEDDNEEITQVVSNVKQTDGGTEVTVARLGGNRWTEFQKVVVSANGLIQTEFFGQKLAHPWVLLTSAHRVGDTWANADSKEFGWAAARNKVAAVERVKVPAGTFEAIRVDLEYKAVDGRFTMTHTYWYAPDIGVVKMETLGRRALVLKSFTPGRE